MAKNKQEVAVAATTVPATTELMTKPGTAHIAVYRPAEVEIYEMDESEDTGIGRDAGSQERRLPILRVLQATNPQVKRGTAAYIHGAKEGDFLNTATNEVIDGEKGFYFIAANKHLKYPLYIKREPDGSGGGFVNIFEPEAPEVRQGQEDRKRLFGNLFGPLPAGQTENGKDLELVETYYIDMIAIMPNEDGSFPGEFGTTFNGSFAFSSTHIRAYNSWQDRLENMTYTMKRRDGSIGPAPATLWTHVWHVKTGIRQRGTQSWMIPVITLGGKDEEGVELNYKFSRLDRNEYLYKRAEHLREEILEGHVELQFEKDTTQETEAGSGHAQGGNGKVDHDEIPFGNT